jgi:lysophospholipase L1-like esterase
VAKANANIAFMGDSITDYWSLPTTNLGVAGNSTLQMLDRFSSQVLGHGYRAVVILGGTNDLRYVVGPYVPEVNVALKNIESMASLAEAAGIEVVLCTLPPIQDETPRVVLINQGIAALAAAHQYKLVDYYTPMADHPEYFYDQVHPNAAGYAVMQAALTEVIPLDY